MKKLMIMSSVLLFSALLAGPALAAKPEEKAAEQPILEKKAAKDPHQSAAFKRQQATVEKREAMKARRDAALKVRERNIKNNSPGNTGM